MSDFGKGFIYCLMNFAKHFDRVNADILGYRNAGICDNTVYDVWINGASDHFFELELPIDLPNEIKLKIRKLQDDALAYGHGAKMMQMTEKNTWNLINC